MVKQMAQSLKSTPWWDDPTAPTPSVGEFLAEYEGDSNLWWRVGCGHHQNLFDAAVDDVLESRLRAEAAEVVIARVVEVVRQARAVSPSPTMSVYVADVEAALTGNTPVLPRKLGIAESPSTAPEGMR